MFATSSTFQMINSIFKKLTLLHTLSQVIEPVHLVVRVSGVYFVPHGLKQLELLMEPRVWAENINNVYLIDERMF